MSVNVCPKCGAQYLKGTMLCQEDGSYLVAESELDQLEVPPEDAADGGDEADAPESDDSTVAYDLADWEIERRVMLDRMLRGEGIIFSWEASTLVISRWQRGTPLAHRYGANAGYRSNEARVDQLIDQIEAAGDMPTLDDDQPQVVYELDPADWGEHKRDALAMSLGNADIHFAFDDDGSLVVYEADEARVEPIIDQVDLNYSIDATDEEFEDDGGTDGLNDDGIAAQQALTDLYVAVDRLSHRPDNSDGVIGAVDAAKELRGFALPFGFAEGAWRDILDRAQALSRLLESDESDGDAADTGARDVDDVDSEGTDDVSAVGADATDGTSDDELTADERIQADARELRDLLRQYV